MVCSGSRRLMHACSTRMRRSYGIRCCSILLRINFAPIDREAASIRCRASGHHTATSSFSSIGVQAWIPATSQLLLHVRVRLESDKGLLCGSGNCN